MYLFFLLLEFFLNRILNRLWIFVPATPVTHGVFMAIQWTGYISMLALYVYSFLLLGYWRALIPATAAVALVALDLVSHIGLYLKLLWLLPLLFSFFYRSRLHVAFSIYYASRGVTDLFLSGPGGYTWFFELTWALLPLLGGFAPNKQALAAAAAAFGIVLASPYYVGMVLIFGLGLSTPSLLPLAVFLALSSRERYAIFPLLVGPHVQLSVHYLVLAVGMRYATRPLKAFQQ